MPDTPNYSWPTPADTDPVRDGAAAIRALAEAIDAELNAGLTFGGYRERVVTLATSGTVTLDLADANVFTIDPVDAFTIAFDNLPAGGTASPFTLVIENDGHPITWPAGTRFVDGEPPDLTGETWLSGVALGSIVTVGAAWTGVST